MSSNQSVRSTAIKIVNELDPNFSGYQKKLNLYKDKNEYSESDEQFLYNLVKGTIIYKKLLDYIVNIAYNSSISQLEPVALNILRIGVYQKEILDTPSHAYVYETVECTKELGRTDLTGLVNGVLRNLPEREVWSQKINKLENQKEQAIRYSHPDWMVQRWQNKFGTENTQKLLQFNNNYTKVFFRHNPLKLSWEEFLSRVPSHQNIKIIQKEPLHFFTVDNPGSILKSELIERGYCSVQDFSQSLSVLLLSPQKGEKIIDACAAPGGKSAYIAQLAQNNLKLIQGDISEERLRILKKNMEQLGIEIAKTVQADATNENFPQADKILLDVPCTGTGVIARKADLRWNKNQNDIKDYVQTQYKILKNMSKFVKKGGTIVYNTCSLEYEENWKVVEKFLSEETKFGIINANKTIANEFCDEKGAMNIKPFKNKLTGSFAVKMVKE